ncbi:hypothetical protein ELZ19_06900 [Brucella abortus]|nr:hypothetical protein ELZ22_16995 [Brucella abortus]RUQ88320.1 hypothetical protein ELZ18_15750 [Brucella abortus]RUQ96535.1 hypothetical protein ELZ21_15445 [Brucella abortus]RUR06677.1 hypothetical protein ELZ19_06900 [Brucella abortus]
MADWAQRLSDRVEYWRERIASLSRPLATIDFETRSACDLKKHGGWEYSKHPTTEAMCLAYMLPGDERPRLWHMAHPQHLIAESEAPLELFAFILAGGLVEAHNAFFERAIWKNVMVARHGWPEMPHRQWRCSASKASAASLPRALEDAAKVMNLGVEKDLVGWRLMLKMSKPRKPRKAEREAWQAEHGDEPMPLLWHEDEDDIYRLWSYCRQDVVTEHAFSSSVRDLSEYETEVWLMDQALNERGVRIDRALADMCLDLAARARKKLNQELEQITGISSGTKRQAVKDWLVEHEGVELPDTAAETLEWYIEREPISGRARRVCEIVKEVNRTSTRKYQKMLYCMGDDDRVRDILMYHGAGTGRWSGKGIQVQNLPKGDLDDMDEACEDILTGDLDWCEAMYGDVMNLLSSASRGAIVSAEGRDFIVADYSAIEARCVLWEAEAQPALDVFRRGEDIYCDMATGIYGYKVDKKVHKKERQFGKQAILGLGYGMGFLTFLLTCRKYKIYFSRADVLRILGREKMDKYEAWVRSYLCLDAPDPRDLSAEETKRLANKRRQAAKARRRLTDAREDPRKIVHELALMKYTVDVYRSRYPEVKQMWTDQEEAAIKAVRDGGRVRCGKVTWFVEDDFLYCELPSGRLLSYRSPEVKQVRTSWGEMKPGLRYMSVGLNNKWERTYTYGGKLVENITQAVARDIMANAMLLAYQGDTYDTVMTVHDELVCEVDEDKGDLREFEALMSDIPAWAAGCPIVAEAERYKRYRK